VVIAMSIFKYFKHVATGTEPDEHKDEGLSEPTGPLSRYVLTKTIKLANAKVTNVTPHKKTKPNADASPKIRSLQAGFRTWHDSFY